MPNGPGKRFSAWPTAGMYDQVGGGFHRYSVDEAWHIPHFEKMGVDNAELLGAYVQGVQQFDEPRFEEVVRGTLGWVREVLANPEGGWGASQDADNAPGDDGNYFTWTKAELKAALDPDEYRLVARVFGVGTDGRMHHDPDRNVLFRLLPVEGAAEGLSLTGTPNEALRKALETLRSVRARRPVPTVDPALYAGDQRSIRRRVRQGGGRPRRASGAHGGSSSRGPLAGPGVSTPNAGSPIGSIGPSLRGSVSWRTRWSSRGGCSSSRWRPLSPGTSSLRIRPLELMDREYPRRGRAVPRHGSPSLRWPSHRRDVRAVLPSRGQPAPLSERRGSARLPPGRRADTRRPLDGEGPRAPVADRGTGRRRGSLCCRIRARLGIPHDRPGERGGRGNWSLRDRARARRPQVSTSAAIRVRGPTPVCVLVPRPGLGRAGEGSIARSGLRRDRVRSAGHRPGRAREDPRAASGADSPVTRRPTSVPSSR